MEFFVVVLIFITCMITLALLIYYCQEYRNKPKYSFTDNQRDISAIALAIAAPGFLTDEIQSAPHTPAFKSAYIPTRPLPPPPGFVTDGIPSVPPADPPIPPPREYMHTLMIPEDMSGSESSSSEHIYYPPKSTAYSVAKRMSVSANAEALARRMSMSLDAEALAKRMSMSVNAEALGKRMSISDYSKGRRSSIPADVAAYFLARRLSETGYLKETNASAPANASAESSDDSQDSQRKRRKNSTNGQFSERAKVHWSNAKTNVSQPQKNETTVQRRNTSPHPSDSTSARSSTSRTDIPEESSSESKKRRSTSPYLPASVVAFRLKNKTVRSGSPYTPLRNDSPCSRKRSDNGLFTTKQSESQSPSPPKRTKRPSLKPAENHPLKFTENGSLKQIETAPPQRSENICFPKQSKSFPPKLGEGFGSKRSTSPERLPFASSEVSYRSYSLAPLHTVEEEE